MAGDHVINLWLEEHGFYMGGFPYLMDPEYRGWSTEQVYNDLEKKAIKIDFKNMPLGCDLLPCEPGQENKAISDVIAAATVAKMTKSAGDLPGEIAVTLDKFLNPKLPWERLFFNYMNELVYTERSFARPSRRYHDPLMPGNTGNNGLEHLVYYLDISGSVTDGQIALFNSEFKSVKNNLEPEKMTMVTFDTVIHDIHVFERNQPFEKLVVTGRGGTSLTEVFKHMKKTVPTAAVIFTDLEVTIPDNPGIPIIWVCVDNPTATVPYGKLVHISTDVS
jgi:predicted metal-dependent peptidase